MKEYISHLVRSAQNPIQARNLVREYLQARILESLQGCGAMVPMAFHGGTALRFLFGIPRFSEDLDFALENPQAGYRFREYIKNVRSNLGAEGYNIETKVSDRKTVHSAFIRFYGLLYEMGLSSQNNESVSIKVEVDTHPPAGAVLKTTLIRRHITLRFQHHDRASLLSGKLHAFLQRSYVKGRDLYDMVWYLSDPDWPLPNFSLLGNALKQTGWQGVLPGPQNWRKVILEHLKHMDIVAAREDVRPFLEQAQEVELITYENLAALLDTTT